MVIYKSSCDFYTQGSIHAPSIANKYVWKIKAKIKPLPFGKCHTACSFLLLLVARQNFQARTLTPYKGRDDLEPLILPSTGVTGTHNQTQFILVL